MTALERAIQSAARSVDGSDGVLADTTRPSLCSPNHHSSSKGSIALVISRAPLQTSAAQFGSTSYSTLPRVLVAVVQPLPQFGPLLVCESATSLN